MVALGAHHDVLLTSDGDAVSYYSATYLEQLKLPPVYGNGYDRAHVHPCNYSKLL